MNHHSFVQSILEHKQQKRNTLWWLGQHSFVLTLHGVCLLMDPYLTPNPRRKKEPLLSYEEAASIADIICGTHDHSDHIDHPFWRYFGDHRSDTMPSFVLPQRVREQVLKDCHLEGLSSIYGLTGQEDSIKISSIQVTAIPAAHEQLDEEWGAHRYLGFIIHTSNLRIYHSGDSCIYEGMHARLRYWHPDVMLIPINGRDAKRLARNCIGNMTFQEAVDLAGSVQPKLVIPTHFDMFEGNSENPESFVQYLQLKYPSISTLIPQYMEPIPLEPYSNLS